MSGCSVTSVERKVNALLAVKRRVYRVFIFVIQGSMGGIYSAAIFIERARI